MSNVDLIRDFVANLKRLPKGGFDEFCVCVAGDPDLKWALAAENSGLATNALRAIVARVYGACGKTPERLAVELRKIGVLSPEDVAG